MNCETLSRCFLTKQHAFIEVIIRTIFNFSFFMISKHFLQSFTIHIFFYFTCLMLLVKSLQLKYCYQYVVLLFRNVLHIWKFRRNFWSDRVKCQSCIQYIRQKVLHIKCNQIHSKSLKTFFCACTTLLLPLESA